MALKIDCDADKCVKGCECYAKDLYISSKKYLEEREVELHSKFKNALEKEVNDLTDRFNLILHNEQVRASYMLREAHRERQEKIQALQTQLECKNLSALMYVMCIERRRSKLEKLRLIEEYTNYIRALQDILSDGQSLILYLARGYKTAARVDQEWRDKMTSIIKEFQAFIYNFTGGTPETNQFFFDIPKLMSIQEPITINPEEDPCYPEESVVEGKEEEEQKAEEEASQGKWWEHVQSECRPFIMFGDMSDFQPDHRRQVTKLIKAEKTIPPIWREYMFNEMFLKRDCSNVDAIKFEYPDVSQMPKYKSWHRATQYSSSHSINHEGSRRATATSAEQTETMGSILKIMSASSTYPITNKTMLLAARDSMEIQSTTKLLEKQKQHGCYSSTHNIPSRVMLDIKKRRQSCLEEMEEEEVISTEEELTEEHSKKKNKPQDSMVLKMRASDPDRINLEKICPTEQCKMRKMDDFMMSLPPYMRANPFVHFEQTFDQYVPLSPEQLQILAQRLENKQKQEGEEEMQAEEPEQDPLAEWTEKVGGVATQTSPSLLPSEESFPCTCHDPPPTPVPSDLLPVYDIKKLFPAKLALDRIAEEFFHDDGIEFNRFKVVGEETKRDSKESFATTRLQNIKNILKKHPSLLDIFQANTRC